MVDIRVVYAIDHAMERREVEICAVHQVDFRQGVTGSS